MGKKKRIPERVIFILMALTGTGCAAAWLAMRGERPWLAFYVACCGGILLINLAILLIFVRKNMK